MATLQEIRDKANTKLATLWPVIVAKEEAYFTNHGQYFGLRWSPANPVVDGVDTPFVLEKPSRGSVLADIQFDMENLPFQIMIERLNQQPPRNITPWVDLTKPEPAPTWGASGETFKAHIRIELPNGDVYRRSRTRENEDSGWNKFQAK